MRMRPFFSMILVIFLLVSLLPSTVMAASATKAAQTNWAKPYVDALRKIGVYPSSAAVDQSRLVSRAEAIMLINRVLEASLGIVSDPNGKANFDYRHPLGTQIKSLMGNINTLFNVQLRSHLDLNPGENMLYHLYLSSRGKEMRGLTVYSSKWWLSASELNRPVTREEASMILFHVLSPQISRSRQISAHEAASRFADLTQLNTDSIYLDTASPFPNLLKDFQIFDTKEHHFNPKQYVTQAEFAVILKHLYDAYSLEKASLIQGTVDNRTEFANLFLAAATYSYQKQRKEEMARYFSSGALKTLKQLGNVPLHDYTGKLTQYKEESNRSVMLLKGEYFSKRIGNYEVYYQIKADETAKNPYGWLVTAVTFIQK